MSYANDLACHYAAVRRRLVPPPLPPRMWQLEPRKPEPPGRLPKPAPKPTPDLSPDLVSQPELRREPISAKNDPARFARALLAAVRRFQYPRSADVLRVTARISGLSETQLLGDRRTLDHVRPRQIGMAVCVLMLRKSTPETGRRFHRDHSTVLHAVQRWRELVMQNLEGKS